MIREELVKLVLALFRANSCAATAVIPCSSTYMYSRSLAASGSALSAHKQVCTPLLEGVVRFTFRLLLGLHSTVRLNILRKNPCSTPPSHFPSHSALVVVQKPPRRKREDLQRRLRGNADKVGRACIIQ